MSQVYEITLIEQVACPICSVPALQHCKRLRSGRDDTSTRTWPWHPDSAGPHWCHKERKDLAIAEGHLRS